MVTAKTCRHCNKTLSPAAFNSSSKNADGLASTCRACTNARRRQRDRSRTDRSKPRQNLATALREGDVKLTQTLLRAGQSPTWNWVCETLREGHLNLAKLLIESHVKPDIFTLSAMADVAGVSARLRQAPQEATLTRSISEPPGEQVTPLHVACASDWKAHGDDRTAAQIETVEILISHGADLNAPARYRGLDNATPLFCACWSSENLQLVRFLLEHGAIPDDRDLMAALGHFQRHGREAYDIADALLSWGLAIDGSVARARTPLQAFAHQAAHQTVSWLIAHGADINARGPGGCTAAHFAAERNTHPTTLALLAEAGANLNVRDNDGNTPLDVARLNEKPGIIDWIEKSR